jgi:hypothetical protein
MAYGPFFPKKKKKNEKITKLVNYGGRENQDHKRQNDRSKSIWPVIFIMGAWAREKMALPAADISLPK